MIGRARGWIVAAGVLLACAGCGFKGPLYLPERNATVVTHPAAAQAAPAPAQRQGPAATKKGQAAPAPRPPAPSEPPQQ